MAVSLRQVLEALVRDPQQAIVDCPEVPVVLPMAGQAYPQGDFRGCGARQWFKARRAAACVRVTGS
jgi:hypothetical protein